MSDGSGFVLLIRTVVSLAVVLVLLIWAARMLERRRGDLLGRRRLQVPVEVLSRQQLSRHADLSVVKVADEILVLGVTDAGVSLLRTVDPQSLPTAETDLTDEGLSPSSPLSSPASFAQALRRAAGLRPESQPAAVEAGSSPGGQGRG